MPKLKAESSSQTFAEACSDTKGDQGIRVYRHFPQQAVWRQADHQHRDIRGQSRKRQHCCRHEFPDQGNAFTVTEFIDRWLK